MALHLDPHGSAEPIRDIAGEPIAAISERAGLIRDGVQTLEHGAMICPSCNAPTPLERRVGFSDPLTCGFCGHRAAAGRYLTTDVYDTVANEVYLVARVPRT